MITALIAASLLMDAPRTHLDDIAHFEGRDLWAVSAPRGSRSVTIPLKRQLSGFEHARIDTEVYIPEGAGVTGVCAKVISWPAMMPIYEYDSKTVVMPVSSVDASQSRLTKVSCDIDLHAMLAAGTVPMPSRLASIELLRRKGAPAATFGVGRVFIEKSGLYAEFSIDNGGLMVGDLDNPEKNNPHFTLVNAGLDREVEFSWKVRHQERPGAKTGHVRCRMSAGERKRVDLPRLDRADVVYVDYTLTALDGEAFEYSQTISYGAMHPAGQYPRLFTDDFLFSVVCHAHFYPVEEQDLMFEYMGQAGINHCRGMPAYFSVVMPTSNSWKIAELTDRVERAHSYGIEPQTSLSIPPRWAVDKSVGSSYPRLDIQEMFAERLVRSLRGKVRYFETSNEMNLTIGRNPKSGWTIENLAEFEKACYRGLKRGNPDAIMLSGEWGGIAFGVGDYYFKNNLSDYDVRAYHYHGSLEQATPVFDTIFKIQREAAPGKPWFADECAISVVNRDLIAGITLFQKCIHAWANGAIGYSWYNLRNKGFNHPGEVSFGILTGDMYPRSGYLVYNALAGTMRDAKFVCDVDAGKNIMAYRFKRDDQNVALFPMWSMSSGFGVQSAYFKTDATRVEWIDAFGNVEECPILDGIAVYHPGIVPGILRLSPAAASFEKMDSVIAPKRALVLTAGCQREFSFGVANPLPNARTVAVKIEIPKGVTAQPAEFALEVPPKGTASLTTTFSAAEDFSPGAAGTTFVTLTAADDTDIGRTELSVEPVFAATPRCGAKIAYSRQEQYTSYVQGIPEYAKLYWCGARDVSGKCTVDYPAGETLHVWFWVQDDVHVQNGNDAEHLYNGDSAQLFLKFPGQTPWEIGLARTDGGEHMTWIWNAPSGYDKSALAGRLRFKTNFDKPDETGVLWYHVWIPLKEFGTSREELLKSGLRMNLMVNDNDGPRREGFISITRGSNPWQTDNYPFIVFEQ